MEKEKQEEYCTYYDRWMQENMGRRKRKIRQTDEQAEGEADGEVNNRHKNNKKQRTQILQKKGLIERKNCKEKENQRKIKRKAAWSLIITKPRTSLRINGNLEKIIWCDCGRDVNFFFNSLI